MQLPVYYTSLVLWGQKEDTPYGKVSFRLGHGCSKAQIILPSTHHSGPDGQTIRKGNEQFRGSWTIGLIGDRAQQVQHIVPTKNYDQGPGLG